MHLEALEKVIRIARKNPRVLLSPDYFEKISARLNIKAAREGEYLVFSYGGRTDKTPIITHENCARFKCRVEEGKSGVMIYEFIIVLVHLLTNRQLPPSPHEKLGPTADFYCRHGISQLEEELFEKGQ